jgi:hypothetical protein
MSLQMVSKLLVNEFPPTNTQPASRKLYQSVERKMLKRVFWGLVICTGGLVIGVAGAKVFHQSLVSAMGALLALMGALIFLSVLRSSTSISPQLARPKTMTSSKSTKELLPEAFSEALPSVAERTTELLKIEKVKVAEHKVH